MLALNQITRGTELGCQPQGTVSWRKTKHRLAFTHNLNARAQRNRLQFLNLVNLQDEKLEFRQLGNRQDQAKPKPLCGWKLSQRSHPSPSDCLICCCVSSATQNVCGVCVCAQSRLTLCDPMDCSPPGFSVHGIFQARILERVAISSSREYSRPRDQTHISCISFIGRQIPLPLCHLGVCLWVDL